MKYIILGLLLVLMSCNTTKTVTQETKQVVEKSMTYERPNVIIMIGDGMGVSQISSRWYYDDSKPQFTRFKSVGLLRTSSGREDITDSAAGATAYSAGVKSYNGAIGVDLDTMPKETILETLEKRGYNSGLVATSSIVHATPASFYAHVYSRKKYEEIAQQLVDSDVDYFAGGGTKFFAKRKDGRNLLSALSANGFLVDTTALATDALATNKKHGFLLADDGMPKMLEGRGEFLSEATKLGIDYLEAKGEPFFMMIEGSQIDWGGHANDGEYLQSEMLDFDNVIGQVLDYAEKDGNTLVIVTADHECGGFALTAAEVYKRRDYRHIKPAFTSGGHSAAMVPLMVYGPGEETFTGIYENTDVYHRIFKILNKSK